MPTRDRQPNARQQQATLRREQILETALRLFAEQGFAATSTRQIARAIGVTEGLIFHYFPSKEALFSAILESGHSFRGELSTLLQHAEGRPVAEVLHQLARGWLATLRRERRLTVVFFSEAQINPQVGAALRDAIEQAVSHLGAYLTLRIAAAELRPDLPVATSARMLLSSIMIFFTFNHELTDAEWEARAETFVAELVAIWLRGAQA
jgi:AcrR family transcriptional regulator